MAVASSPQVLGVLAHDLRWTIVGLLVPGDLRTSELVARTGQAPSLVSYHLARLRDAGLVSARRSAADGRDSYHALDLDALGQAVAGAAAGIHPGLLAARAGPPVRSAQPTQPLPPTPPGRPAPPGPPGRGAPGRSCSSAAATAPAPPWPKAG